MRHSIKNRITFVFVGLMAFVLIAIWCVNNWFLEGFYTRDKVRSLELAYQTADRIVAEAADQDKNIIEYYGETYDASSENEGKIQKLFRRMAEKYNLSFFIIDSTTDDYLMINNGDVQYLKNRMNSYIFGQNMPDTTIMEHHEGYTIQNLMTDGRIPIIWTVGDIFQIIRRFFLFPRRLQVSVRV